MWVKVRAEDLAADYERQDGYLSRSQVDRLILKRDLSPIQIASLNGVLDTMGVVICIRLDQI